MSKKNYVNDNARPSYVVYVHAIDDQDLERIADIAEEHDLKFLQITHYDHFISKKFNKDIFSA